MDTLDPILKCAVGDDALAVPGVEESVAITKDRMQLWLSTRETPSNEKAFMIGLIIDCVGNVDDANEVTDDQIYDCVKVLNYEIDQSQPEILTRTPTSYVGDSSGTTGLQFYVKEIRRNYVLPSGTWHSMSTNVDTAYFGNNNSMTMLKASAGGVDPDRFRQYINVVITNFSTDGENPRTFTSNFINIGASGFSWCPRDIVNNPFLNIYDKEFRQRIVLQSAYVGGITFAPNINTWLAEEGYTYNDPPFGGVFAHEMGHYLDLYHTWGVEGPQKWSDPNFHLCAKDPVVGGIDINDGPCQFQFTNITPSQDYTTPAAGRDECFYVGSDTPTTVPYTNIMNYSSDSLSIQYTASQTNWMRRCLITNTFGDYRVPLTETTAPINFNDTTSIIQGMLVDGQPATRAYMGSQKVWDVVDVPDPGPGPLPPVPPGTMTQPTTLNQYYSNPSNKSSIAVKFWLHRQDSDAVNLIDLEVDFGSGFEKAPYSIQRAGNFKTEYDGVMYYQWYSSIVLGGGGTLPDEPFKRWRVRYNGGAWSGQLPTQPSGSVDPEFPYFVIPGTPNFFTESELEDV